MGFGSFIDDPASSGNPRRATIKAHPTAHHPRLPLQISIGSSQVDAYQADNEW
ncbi:MAG TPA: hypothetical protein VEH81_06545 [Ktedonobacteraceae bacterium]|nr:hypothetical protein [Ktedonobacteraceae bacterium]